LEEDFGRRLKLTSIRFGFSKLLCKDISILWSLAD
jgi:hypothetical protein